MRRDETRDRAIVNEMWSVANNEPLTLGAIQAFGFVDRERYRRYVDGHVIELTLDCDPRTKIWSYEFAIVDSSGVPVDEDVVSYWLGLFFGTESTHAAKRSYLMTNDARFTFPYRR